MKPILHESGETHRLTLALLLALALHGALLFAVPAEYGWRRPFEQPSLTVVLRPLQRKPSALASDEDAAKLTASTESTVERTVAPLAPDGLPNPPLAAPVPLPLPESVGPSRPVVSAKTPPPAKTRLTPASRLNAKPTTSTASTDSNKAKAVVRLPAKPTATGKSSEAVSEKRWSVPNKPPAKHAASARAAQPPPVEPELDESGPAADLTESPRSDRGRQSTAATRPAAQKRDRRSLDSSALLGQIASLEAQSQRQARPGIRAKRVSPNDSQSLEGFYIGSWVRKVEQIGEMNFPDVARQLNLSAGPTLEVAIRADGSLHDVRVTRSSGNAELDRAAQRIVRLGAPYAAFPPQLRQQYDLLYISRPWRFESSGRLRMR